MKNAEGPPTFSAGGGKWARRLRAFLPSALVLPVVLYCALTLPYAFTKLNGDETHFVTLPYLILGGDYTLSALKQGDYAGAFRAAATSYRLAWRYLVRPADAAPDSAAELSQFRIESKASGRDKPFVFTPDYFVTHRKTGKPLLGFLLNIPALAVTYVLPRDLYYYQKNFIYHPAFLAPRLSVFLLGLLGVVMVFHIVQTRVDTSAAFRAAAIYALMPITVVWSADLHQEVPMTFFLIPYFYFLWKRRLILAGLLWGLAFGTKNQAVFALVPILAEGIWSSLDPGTIRERLARIAVSFRTLAIVLGIGLLASAPFGYPVGNLVEVVRTSALDITNIQDATTIFSKLPLWTGIAMLAILGLKLAEDARDSFDRMHLFMLIVPGMLFFITDYRAYMMVPSVAILVGTYFRPRLAAFLAAAFLAINLWGLQSPYLTSRRLLYKWLLNPGMPHTVEEIDALPGVGGISSEPPTKPAENTGSATPAQPH
jgi:hypothetical protein